MALEALAAVGLASNVMQFVQFGCSLMSLTSTINKKAFTGHDDFETIAKNLQGHLQSLKCDTEYDESIHRLSNMAHSVASDLLTAIDKLRNIGRKNGNVTHSRWTSFRRALETIWKADKITSLQSRLESLRDQLHFHLVKDIG